MCIGVAPCSCIHFEFDCFWGWNVLSSDNRDDFQIFARAGGAFSKQHIAKRFSTAHQQAELELPQCCRFKWLNGLSPDKVAQFVAARDATSLRPCKAALGAHLSPFFGLFYLGHVAKADQVLAHARKVLKDANARLAAGEDCACRLPWLEKYRTEVRRLRRCQETWHFEFEELSQVELDVCRMRTTLIYQKVSALESAPHGTENTPTAMVQHNITSGQEASASLFGVGTLGVLGLWLVWCANMC